MELIRHCKYYVYEYRVITLRLLPPCFPLYSLELYTHNCQLGTYVVQCLLTEKYDICFTSYTYLSPNDVILGYL